jgi:hypothetical protein
MCRYQIKAKGNHKKIRKNNQRNIIVFTNGIQGKEYLCIFWQVLQIIYFKIENRIMKPIKIILKGGREGIIKSRWIWSKYIIGIYGSITI